MEIKIILSSINMENYTEKECLSYENFVEQKLSEQYPDADISIETIDEYASCPVIVDCGDTDTELEMIDEILANINIYWFDDWKNQGN